MAVYYKIDKIVEKTESFDSKLHNEIRSLYDYFLNKEEDEMAKINRALIAGLYDKNRYNLVYKQRNKSADSKEFVLIKMEYKNLKRNIRARIKQSTYEDSSNMALLVNDLIMQDDFSLMCKFMQDFPHCPLNPVLAVAIYNNNMFIKNDSIVNKLNKICPLSQIRGKVSKNGYKYFDRFPEASHFRLNYYIAFNGQADFGKLFKPYIESYFRQINNDEFDTAIIKISSVKHTKDGDISKLSTVKTRFNLPLIEVFEKTGLYQEDVNTIFSNPNNDNKKALQFLLDNAILMDEDKLLINQTIKNLSNSNSLQM